MSDLSGKIIHGYEFIEPIGIGGFGAVYRASDTSVERDVAIKVILPQYTSDPIFQQRFEQEARLVAQLEHPHIIPLYSYWQDEHGAFLVMRFVQGGSLKNVLETQGALSVTQVERILSHLTEALSVAHTAGVVHRDLKPDNILLDDKGNAYLTDFGIAKQIDKPDGLTAPDGIMGTMKYLSPEQLQSQPVSAQSDIYSLGIMLYEMLTGEHPFKDAITSMLIIKHLQDSLPYLTDSRPDLPMSLDDVIQKATAKEAHERYDSVLELLQDFQDALHVEAIAEPITPVSVEPIKPHPKTQDERNRDAMLQNVRTFWVEGVLEKSLYNAVMLELGMTESAGAVDNPWQSVLKVPDTPDETLSADVDIVDVFDRMQGKLLILGEPGSGKTTTLLTLTRDLLNRAEWDTAHPIPVVFNLSSWAENRKPLVGWMIDELNLKYQVPKKVAQQWLDAEDILPLLDGLDEVAIDHRDACVEIINAYRSEHGFVDVVVCSRIADYKALTNKLRLNGAITLQPLQREQVDSYLAQAGDGLTGVRKILEDDDKLRQLTTSPLMLNILTMAYRDMDIDDIPQFDSLEGRRTHLFETYVDRMLERRGQDAPYSKEKTIQYLTWLGKNMSQNALSVLYIEELQPTWLEGLRNRGSYLLLVAFITMLASGIFFGYPGAMFFEFEGMWKLIRWLFGFSNNSTNEFIAYLAMFAFWGSSLFLALKAAFNRNGRPLIWLLGSILIPVVITALLLNASNYGFLGSLYDGIGGFLVWFAITGIAGFIFGIIPSIRYLFKWKIEPVDTLRWSWRNALKGAIFWGMLIGLGGSIVLTFGSFIAPYHWNEILNEPNNLQQLITDAQKVFLPSLLTGSFVGLIIGALFGGVQGQKVEYRNQPNENIHKTWKIGVVISYMFMLIMLFSFIFVPDMIYQWSDSDGFRHIFWNRAIGWPMLIIFFGTLFTFILANTALTKGGYSSLQHLALRLITWWTGILPRNVADFLDYTSEQILMRKVGGGYIFTHRMLLEYFANLAQEDEADETDRIARLSDGTTEGDMLSDDERDSDEYLEDQL